MTHFQLSKRFTRRAAICLTHQTISQLYLVCQGLSFEMQFGGFCRQLQGQLAFAQNT